VLHEEADFGDAATALSERADCPVLVVRPSSIHVSIRPGSPQVQAQAAAAV